MNFDVCKGAELATAVVQCSAGTDLPGDPFFLDISSRFATNPSNKHYGVSVTDVNGDGKDEFFVTGFGNNNQAFTWDKASQSFRDILLTMTAAQDPAGKAIGVAACDVDGDGIEEVFVLNTDSYSGPTTKTSVRLYKKSGESSLVDLFSLAENEGARSYAAGRSVACVDRFGEGRYGVVLANYGLPFNLYEVDEQSGLLQNVAAEAGIEQASVGGRGLVSGPLRSDFAMDIFANNERSVNWLMQSDGNGGFANVAAEAGLEDGSENGRGTAIFDANDDGLLDLVWGNWNGEHRLFVQDCEGAFEDVATQGMAAPSPIRTVIAADFDNDGYQELFFNNIPGSNRLFSRSGDGKTWVQVDIGDAREASGYGTGAGVADLDDDGRLELLVSHGESASQPLSLFVSTAGLGNGFLRIRPLTAHGAPARGATVRAHHASGRKQLQAIDAGSGYLCQQEPAAHFGLGDGSDAVLEVVVRWPSGDVVTLTAPSFNTTLFVSPPAAGDGSVVVTGRGADGAPATCEARATPELGSVRSAVCAEGDEPANGTSSSAPSASRTTAPSSLTTAPHAAHASAAPTASRGPTSAAAPVTATPPVLTTSSPTTSSTTRPTTAGSDSDDDDDDPKAPADPAAGDEVLSTSNSMAANARREEFVVRGTCTLILAALVAVRC